MRSELTRRELLAAAGTAAVASSLPRGALAQESSPGEWPTAGYDTTRAGSNPDGVGPTEDVGGAWRFGTEAPISAGPVVTDSVVYAAGRDGFLHAIEADTGEVVEGWPVELDAESASTPTVADGTVYVGDDDGTLHAIDAESGEHEWRFGTGGSIEGSPAVRDGTVYVGSIDGFVYAIDAESGTETEWEFDTQAGIEGSVAVDDSGEEPTVYAGNAGGAVFALDAETGEQRWAEPAIARGQIRSSVAVADGGVYVGSVSGVEGFVTAFDADTGEEAWEFEADGAVIGAPAAADGTIYVGSRSQHLVAIDAAAGDEQWRFDTGRQVINRAAIVGETVYVASFNGNVFGLTPGGDEQFVARLDGTVSASPAVADGTIYVGGEDGTLSALEAGSEFSDGGGVGGTDDGEGDDERTDSPLQEDRPGGLTFLVFPAAVVTFFGLVAAGVYAVLRSDWTDKYVVDEAPVESLYEDEDGIPDYDDRTETEAWSLIVGDVIKRASQQTKTAKENIIVTKHVNDALDAPIAAYEIESARDGVARITLTEPLVGERADIDEQPLNEGWTLGEELVFEATIDPGETIKTMVGRTDCDEESVESLLEQPNLKIETVEDES